MMKPVYEVLLPVQALYTPMCIWRVLLVMRVADSTFHDEFYLSPTAKGLKAHF